MTLTFYLSRNICSNQFVSIEKFFRAVLDPNGRQVILPIVLVCILVVESPVVTLPFSDKNKLPISKFCTCSPVVAEIAELNTCLLGKKVRFLHSCLELLIIGWILAGLIRLVTAPEIQGKWNWAMVEPLLECLEISFCPQLQTFLLKLGYEKDFWLCLDKRVEVFDRTICDTLELFLILYQVLSIRPLRLKLFRVIVCAFFGFLYSLEEHLSVLGWYHG